MALSASTRALRELPNLVLYVDVRINPDTGSIRSFLAEIHEETEATLKAFPYLPSRDSQILHCYGVRLEELSAALAFIDVLFGTNPSKGHRSVVESRLLEAKDRQRSRFTICNKVRHQGELSDPSLAANRLALFSTTDSSLPGS